MCRGIFLLIVLLLVRSTYADHEGKQPSPHSVGEKKEEQKAADKKFRDEADEECKKPIDGTFPRLRVFATDVELLRSKSTSNSGFQVLIKDNGNEKSYLLPDDPRGKTNVISIPLEGKFIEYKVVPALSWVPPGSGIPLSFELQKEEKWTRHDKAGLCLNFGLRLVPFQISAAIPTPQDVETMIGTIQYEVNGKKIAFSLSNRNLKLDDKGVLHSELMLLGKDTKVEYMIRFQTKNGGGFKTVRGTIETKKDTSPNVLVLNNLTAEAFAEGSRQPNFRYLRRDPSP